MVLLLRQEVLCGNTAVLILVFYLQEALESCQTRVSKLELHQQEQQAQQSETVNAKVLLGKCINVILAFMTVILVCVSTIAKFIAPMMKSRFHIICTFFAVTLLAIFCKNWDHIICAIERMIIPRWSGWSGCSVFVFFSSLFSSAVYIQVFVSLNVQAEWRRLQRLLDFKGV